MPSLFKRVSALVSATAHDAIDSVESPDSMIKQLIRDSTDNITRARTLAIEAVASEKKLGNDIKHHTDDAIKWQEAAQSAMDNKDEDAARSALKKKIEIERLLENLKPQHETAVANGQALKTRLADLESSLANLKSKKSALLARQKGAEAIREADKANLEIMSQSDINDQVLRAEELVSDLEARNAAVEEINSVTHPEIDLEAKFDEAELNKELAALRT